MFLETKPNSKDERKKKKKSASGGAVSELGRDTVPSANVRRFLGQGPEDETGGPERAERCLRRGRRARGGRRPPPPPPANLEMVQPLGFGIKIRSPSGAQKALWATRHISVERRKVGKGAPPRSLPARPDVLGERRGSGAPRLMCALSFASLGVLAGVSAPWPLGRPPGLRAAAPLSVLS